jgi:uncharacterized membrane protein
MAGVGVIVLPGSGVSCRVISVLVEVIEKILLSVDSACVATGNDGAQLARKINPVIIHWRHRFFFIAILILILSLEKGIITPTMPNPKPFSHKTTLFIVILTGLLFGIWLFYSPPGLLGKADAVGYAVCHRIDVRSFHLDDRQTPMCARCTGMYLGAFAGIIYQLRWRKNGGYPPKKFYPVLALFVLAFGIDGLNSYLHFFPDIPTLYEPANWLRLLTGTGMGLDIALVMYPTFNQTIWDRYDEIPVFSRWRDLLWLILIAFGLDAMTYSEISLLLYPLAFISSLTVLVLLALVYAILWSLILKRENTNSSWKEAAPILVCGLATALLQIGVFDLVRYLLTGTWYGFLAG